MKKLALLHNPAVVSRVFTPAALDRLSGMTGELAFPASALRETPGEMERIVQGAETIITSWTSPVLSRELLELAPGLKLVLHAAGSVKPIVSNELLGRRVPIVSSAPVLSRGVAETALGLTLTALKNVWEVADAARTGDWWNNRADPIRGRVREMYGVSIGVIGAGQAGRRYMELLRPFQVDVLLYDPTVSPAEAASLGALPVSLERLMEESDVVLVLAPELPETYRMINEARLALMKPDAVLINLARGSLIDEAALRRRLERGRLRVILDVTDPEPPPAGHWLRTHPDIMLTGHIAGAVNNGLWAIGDFVVEELARFIAGEPLRGEIDPARLHLLA